MSTSSPNTGVSHRLHSIDALRGIVMVLMALDHVRDFFHSGAMSQSPTDMASTTPAVFLTRWITHFCAPVFLFLAGVGAFQWFQRAGGTRAQLSRFLLTRGLWLIFLELTVMRVAFDFSLDPKFPILLITLWALGGSMIALAALIHLPAGLLAGLSLSVIALHNLADPVQASGLGSLGWVWNLLHQPGAIVVHGIVVIVGYPLLPLAATMAAGYSAGHLFRLEAGARQRILWRLGLGMILGFLLLRAINVYGDPSRWIQQKSRVMTALSFLNTTKYPASLDFLLMTLGPALLVLACLESARPTAFHRLRVFGSVPLFYFVAHFFLIHAMYLAVTWFRYGAAPFLLLPPPSMGGDRALFPNGFGYELWVVYLVWAVTVAAMYKPCAWFSNVKRERRTWWLSYL